MGRFIKITRLSPSLSYEGIYGVGILLYYSNKFELTNSYWEQELRQHAPLKPKKSFRGVRPLGCLDLALIPRNTPRLSDYPTK